MTAVRIILALALAAVAGGCSSPDPGAGKGLTVAVSILPQQGLVEALGAGRLAVVTAVAPGQAPHSFDPSPRHMGTLAGASIFFACGAPMENQLLPRLRSSYPRMRIVDTAAGLPRLALDGHEHDHGDGHGHEDSGGLDPHLWLDPVLLARMVEVMAAGLAELDPDGAALYAARSDSLQDELARLDREIREILAPVRGREVFVFHPAYGYFTQAYGLRQTAIEQGGIDPSPRHLAEVLGRIKAQGSRAVFVQPQFSLGSAQAVARDAGVELVVLDPLAPDVIGNLRAMAHTIREALDDR
ncbi:MAG: metal ABC transporter solute-binding protein, Zn/Mn family [Candidatus Krumholzibacteriia bacterium]